VKIIKITSSCYRMYQDSLDSASRVRYKKKLQLLGLQQCPYAVNKSCLIDDVGCWPPVSWPELHEYLVNSVGQFTNAAMKAYKSLEAYKYYSDGWVHCFCCARNSSCCSDGSCGKCYAKPEDYRQTS